MTIREPAKPDGPTRAIVEFARRSPGGIIRWGDAEGLYLRNSKLARQQKSRGERHYCMTLRAILRRYFDRVYEQVSPENYADIEADAGGPIEEHLRWEPSRGLYALREYLEPAHLREEILEEPHVDATGTQWYFMYSMPQLLEALDIFQN